MTHRLTIKQIAAQMNRPASTVKGWARVYRWPHIRLGKCRLFDLDEVEKHMKLIGYAYSGNIRGAA